MLFIIYWTYQDEWLIFQLIAAIQLILPYHYLIYPKIIHNYNKPGYSDILTHISQTVNLNIRLKFPFAIQIYSFCSLNHSALQLSSSKLFYLTQLTK